jgi:hypothetical protein
MKVRCAIGALAALAVVFVPVKIASLMEGVMKAMLLTKLKTVTAMLLVLGMFAVGGGLLEHQKARAQQSKAEQEGANPANRHSALPKIEKGEGRPTRAEDDDDCTGVRKHARQYMDALAKADKAGLENLLHKDYQGRELPGIHAMVDKTAAITYWCPKCFITLNDDVESVRVIGNTAIQTGHLSAECKEYGLPAEWRLLSYTRVWLREGKSWRLFHEQF